MSRRTWVALVALVGVIIVAFARCHHQPDPVNAPPVATQKVADWMHCQECDRNERARVVALGDTAVPMLQGLLLDGPQADEVDRERRYLDRLKTPMLDIQPPTQASLDAGLEDYV